MQDKQVSNKALTGSIVISMFLWGLSWPSGKVLTHYCSAVNFAVYRYVIVVTTLFPLLSFLKVSFAMKKAAIPFIVASGALLAFYSFCFFKGLQAGSAGAGGVLVTTLNPIIAYTIGILLTRKLPSKNEGAGLVLGLIAGCVLLKLWSNTGSIFASGNLYFLLASLTWSVMSKITSRGARYGSSLVFSLCQYLVTICCLLPLMNIRELHSVIHIRDPYFWANAFFSSAIVTTFATTIYFYATTRLGAERASSFIFLVPLAAALSAWFLLGERVLPHTAIGGALGMAAVYLINRKSAVKEERIPVRT